MRLKARLERIASDEIQIGYTPEQNMLDKNRDEDFDEFDNILDRDIKMSDKVDDILKNNFMKAIQKLHKAKIGDNRVDYYTSHFIEMLAHISVGDNSKAAKSHKSLGIFK